MAEEADAPSRSRFRSLLLLLPCCRDDADADGLDPPSPHLGPHPDLAHPDLDHPYPPSPFVTSSRSPASRPPSSSYLVDPSSYDLDPYDLDCRLTYDLDRRLNLVDRRLNLAYHPSGVYKGGSVSSATAHRVEVRIPESKEESGDITETGDITEIFRLEKYDIEVRIPPNNAYSAKDITVEVINEVPPELKIKETEAIITYGLKMKAPHNAIFEHPVQVTMPHSAIFTKPSKAEIIAYYRKSASGEFVAIPSTEGSVPCCVVRKRDLDIYFKHFCEYWFVSLRNMYFGLKEIFIGKRLVCTPYVPMPPFLSGMQVLLVHIRDAHKKEEKAPTGYTAPFEGDDFLFKWGSGPMEITCPQSTTGDFPKVLEESEIRFCRDLKPRFELDTTNTREAKMNVMFVLKQSKRRELLVPMNLIETPGRSSRAHNSTPNSSSSTSALDLSQEPPPVDSSASARTSSSNVGMPEHVLSDAILLQLSKEINCTVYPVSELAVDLGYRCATAAAAEEMKRDPKKAYLTILQMFVLENGRDAQKLINIFTVKKKQLLVDIIKEGKSPTIC